MLVAVLLVVVMLLFWVGRISFWMEPEGEMYLVDVFQGENVVGGKEGKH